MHLRQAKVAVRPAILDPLAFPPIAIAQNSDSQTVTTSSLPRKGRISCGRPITMPIICGVPLEIGIIYIIIAVLALKLQCKWKSLGY